MVSGYREVEMNIIARHVIFTGRVQGVGFRFTVLNVANRYRLTGWVRNTLDGSVEMIAQGRPDDISDCIRGIEETYGRGITETRTEEIESDTSYKDFKITF